MAEPSKCSYCGVGVVLWIHAQDDSYILQCSYCAAGGNYNSPLKVREMSIDMLTKQQMDVLNFIQTYITTNSIAPSIREIGAGCGINSISQVSTCLDQLEELGKIRRISHGKSQTIVLVSQSNDEIQALRVQVAYLRQRLAKSRDKDPWISVDEIQPEGSPIVFMYAESNNEYSCGHFQRERSGVPVTHWQPLRPPVGSKWINQTNQPKVKPQSTGDYGPGGYKGVR